MSQQMSFFETNGKEQPTKTGWKDKPIFSICRLSDNRYYWVVWENYHAMKQAIDNDEINHKALGSTNTRDEAIAEAKKITGNNYTYRKAQAANRYRMIIKGKKYKSAWESIRYDLPRFSTCSLGKNRWFWIAWAEGSRNGQGIFDVGDFDFVTHQGYAKSKDEAIAEAKAAVGDEATMFRARTAQSYHKEVIVKSKRKANTDTTEAAPAEYVYTTWWSDFGHSRIIRKHRIAKKTKKRIYVLEREGEEKTFVLDRHKMETEGSDYNHGQWEVFYSEEGLNEILANEGRPPLCFEALGLESDATEADVKKAYKAKAKELHPDAGGNEADFIRLKKSYDQALHLAKSRAAAQ